MVRRGTKKPPRYGTAGKENIVHKRKLSYDEQIQHCIHKGITFNRVSTDTAREYLRNNNNFFKLLSYRKNFPKRDGDETYLRLDFSQLVDLAVIDTRLRMTIIEMSLNIEHFAKVKLLRAVTETSEEDGYTVVRDYVRSLNPSDKQNLSKELERNKRSIYVADLYNKYILDLPVWVFVEMISFGRFIHFYRFCGDRFHNKNMVDDSYLFWNVKGIRNACAHNNCLINDLSAKNVRHRPNYELNRLLSRMGFTTSQRRKKLSSERVSQIITCLYTYHRIVKSEGSTRHMAEKLSELKARFFRDYDYHDNTLISTTFIFIGTVIDNLFPIRYD